MSSTVSLNITVIARKLNNRPLKAVVNVAEKGIEKRELLRKEVGKLLQASTVCLSIWEKRIAFSQPTLSDY